MDLNLHLGSELDLQRLLQSFGHAAREIIGARYAVTGILDADGSRLQSLYTNGMDAETAAQLGSPDPRSGVLRTVLREGRCVRVQNPGGDPAALGFSPSRPPIHAWLGAPIASPTRIYGYIGLIDKVGLDEFSKEDERLAGILAAQVGRVYQNGSLYAEVLRHASDLEREMAARERTEKALAERVREGLLAGEVGAALTRSDTLQGMLQLCAEALVRHLDVAFARIWTLNEAENVLELKASAGLYTHIDGPHSRVPMGELKIGRIAEERAPHFTNDVLTDPRVSDKEWAKRENLVAFAGYPLVVEDRLVGVVGMFACQPLNPATVDAIGSVAHEIALGVERSRANEALRQREEHIRLLLDSTAEAIYGIDLQGRCTFANAACARLLGYADPSQLLGRNMHDLMHHTRRDGTPYPVEECRIFRAFRQNQGSSCRRRGSLARGWVQLPSRVLVVPDLPRRAGGRLRSHISRHHRTQTVGGAVPPGSAAAPGRCRLQPSCPLHVGDCRGRGPAVLVGPATTCKRCSGIRRKSPSARTGGRRMSTRMTWRGSFGTDQIRPVRPRPRHARVPLPARGRQLPVDQVRHAAHPR